MTIQFKKDDLGKLVQLELERGLDQSGPEHVNGKIVEIYPEYLKLEREEESFLVYYADIKNYQILLGKLDL